MYYNSLDFFDAMNDGKSDENREKEEKLMMKKLAAVSVVLILMLALFTSCDKDKKDSNKKDSMKSESTESNTGEGSEETDYRVKADPDVLDEGGTLALYDCACIEDYALGGIVKEKTAFSFDDEKGHMVKTELENLGWDKERLRTEDKIWIDMEIEFKSYDEKYYIALGYGEVIQIVPGKGTFYGVVSEELMDILSGIGKDVSDKIKAEKLSEEECRNYALKCFNQYVKYQDAAGINSPFLPDDDSEKYVVTSYVGLEYESVVDVRIEKTGNPSECFYFQIDMESGGVISGEHFSVNHEKDAPPENLSYEGLELCEVFRNKKSIFYSDGHFWYEINDIDGYIRFMACSDEASDEHYHADPVEDFVADADAYLERLYPGLINKENGWEGESQAHALMYSKKNANDVLQKYINILYDDQNRLEYVKINTKAFEIIEFTIR